MRATAFRVTKLVTSIFAAWILAVHFFNWSHCVLCAPSDTWVFRCMMFIFCVKEADWGDGLGSILCPLVFRIVHHVFHVPCTVERVSNTLVQATLGVGSVSFRPLPLLGQRGPQKVRRGPATLLKTCLPSHGLHRVLHSLRVRLSSVLSMGSLCFSRPSLTWVRDKGCWFWA